MSEYNGLQSGEVRNRDGKPRMVMVTNPAEIEAIQRSGLDDPIGGPFAGGWVAYAWSLERYRETLARAAAQP